MRGPNDPTWRVIAGWVAGRQAPGGVSLLAVRPTDGPARLGAPSAADPPTIPTSANAVGAGGPGGRQVLICPACQADRPDWASSLDRCEACGGTRLSAMLGEVVCRACGHSQPANAGA